MKQTEWNFYSSGIYCGSLRREGERTLSAVFDPVSGTRGDWQELKADNLYQKLSSRNPDELLGMMEELNAAVREGKDCFTTADGSSFSRSGEAVEGICAVSYLERNRKFVRDLLVKDGEVYAVLMPGRDYCAVLVQDGREAETPLCIWEKVYPARGKTLRAAAEALCRVRFAGTFRVETEDHEFLATDVYLPVNSEKTELTDRVPAVLVRTPYGKGRGVEQYYRFVQRGYAVVIQDVRGREDSTGRWLPNSCEVEDGRDTLAWIAAQVWSNQKVAMTGGSYLGYVQWAAAASGSPYLKAMLSSVCAGSAFVDVPRRGGAFCSGMLAWGFAVSQKRMHPELMLRDDWDKVLDIRPLREIPRRALGYEVDFLTEWLSHTDEDALWKKSNWQAAWRETERRTGKKIEVPALIMSGWFDDNGMGTTEALELMEQYAPGHYKAILGPWMHSGNANHDLHGVWLGERALRYDMDFQCFLWLEHFLNGTDNGAERGPAVEYYTLGENCWKQAVAWPVPNAEIRSFYLNAAQTHQNSGALLEVCSSKEGRDYYDYDPANPATHIVDLSENELEVPEDYTEEELRPDVLVYTTEPFQKPLTVTGDAMAKLWISSDCPDTDLVVRITDVDANGRSIKLADGMRSVRYRNGFEHAEFMRPGEVYQVQIRTTKLSNCFLPGHRLRFTITSSAKNFIFPNSNTEAGYDSQLQRVAHNCIHTGGIHASCLELRVERESGRKRS